jgi:hypothetical protein
MDPVRAIYLSGSCVILIGIILTIQAGEPYSWLFILPAIAIAGAYSLSPQIRWWYWQRHAPDLPTGLAPLLERFALYGRLDLAGKREFRRRAFLIRENLEFTGMAIEQIPEDVRLMVSASAATVTFYRQDFLIPGFENVIFYKHLFPTPVHERLHSSELYPDDGVVIYTLNYLIRSVIESDKYLHLGIYEFTRALFYTEPGLRTLLEPHQLNYAEIKRLADFSESALQQFIGLEELDRTAITVTLFHTHRERFARLFPDRFGQLDRTFSLPIPA